jgi:hypothetical protein
VHHVRAVVGLWYHRSITGELSENQSRLSQSLGSLGKQASAGWKHNLAVGLGGQLLSWGWGGSVGTQSMYDSDSSTGGQLGLDTEFDSWSPTAVPQVIHIALLHLVLRISTVAGKTHEHDLVQNANCTKPFSGGRS